METALQDVRYALRQLRKAPGFAAIAVLTLGLGIGANAVIFSLVNAVLVRPLPFPDADHVLRLREQHDISANLTGATFRDLRERNHSFSAVAAYRVFPQNLSASGNSPAPEEVDTAFVSDDFLPLLQVQPILGRGLGKSGEPELLLSYGLWQRQFGADSGVVGKHVMLHGELRTVSGVMPAGFRFPDQVQAWALLGTEGMLPQNRRAHLFTTLEIGVRVALGARRFDVLRLVVGGAMKMAAIGLGIGLVLALLLTRALSSALFGVVQIDVVTFALLTCLLALIAALAAYIPARSAMKVDPMVALRYE